MTLNNLGFHLELPVRYQREHSEQGAGNAITQHATGRWGHAAAQQPNAHSQ